MQKVMPFIFVLVALFVAACQPIAPDPMLEQNPSAPTLRPIVTIAGPTAQPASGGGAVSPGDLDDPTTTGLVDPILEEFISDAKVDLAARLGLSEEMITVISTESVDWPDSSIGCPDEDEVAAQVITPGYRILLQAADTVYEYHAALDWMRFCEDLP